MHSELSEETRNRITGLCNSISVAHHLDNEIREELRDHITDKIEAYLSGDEALTEDDAFVLVREHFGDPGVIRSLYETAEPAAAYGSMLRRIGAALVATILTFTLGSHVVEILLATLARMTPGSLVPQSLIFGIPKAESYIIGLLLFAIVLSYWKKKISRGEQPWFFTIKPIRFVGLIMLSLLVTYSVIAVTFQFQASSDISGYLWLLGILFHCILWIWWMDTNPRRVLNIFIGLFSWMIAQYFIMNIISILSVFFTSPSNYSTEHFLNIINIFKYYPSQLNVPAVLAVTIYALFIGVRTVRIKIQHSLLQ